jgi:hypothetical protein
MVGFEMGSTFCIQQFWVQVSYWQLFRHISSNPIFGRTTAKHPLLRRMRSGHFIFHSNRTLFIYHVHDAVFLCIFCTHEEVAVDILFNFCEGVTGCLSKNLVQAVAGGEDMFCRDLDV